ncbi:MAG: VOC family protein [Thermodesulfobacteriota bacterium]
MIRRIDHVAIAVRDLERAKHFFIECLGGRELFCAPFADQGYRWTTLELGSSCFIELIDPLSADGFVHRFIEKRGEGPHHITIQVDDLEAMHKMLEGKGIKTFGYSEALPGWKEFYIHPKEAFGTLIQFAEFNPLDWIDPGYVPPSYREFVPEQQVGAEDNTIAVRRMAGEKGPEIEIRRGDRTLCIPESRVPDLIQALETITSK